MIGSIPKLSVDPLQSHLLHLLQRLLLLHLLQRLLQLLRLLPLLHCIRFSRRAAPDPGAEAQLPSSSSPSMCQMWSNLPSRTSFLHTVNSLPRSITVIPAQSITRVCGSKSNQRKNGSLPTTSQKNAPVVDFPWGWQMP